MELGSLKVFWGICVLITAVVVEGDKLWLTLKKMQLPEYLREFSYEKTDYFRRTQIIYVSTITTITWGTSVYLTNFLDIICY